MANFDELLEGLHSNSKLSDELDAKYPIIITQQRNFDVPVQINPVLGFAGDVNSQILTFQCPLYQDAHDLSGCHNKKIKWKNLQSLTEGISDLIVKEINVEQGFWIAEWEVPPELMAIAGTLEIGISLYDIKDNVIVFSWNTATFQGFSIGESFTDVGQIWDSGKLPAKNEILNVDIESRSIVAPVGYKNIVCNYGDIGTSKIFFQVNKIIRGIDLTNTNTEMSIIFNLGQTATDKEKLMQDNIKPLFQNNEKLIICWEIPEEITNNEYCYTGNFTIALMFEIKDKDTVIKRWISSSYSQLSIGESSLLNDINSIAIKDENRVIGIIDNYMDTRDFIIGNE